jgi:hypothetical protein
MALDLFTCLLASMTAAGFGGTAQELVTWNMVFQNNKIKKRGETDIEPFGRTRTGHHLNEDGRHTQTEQSPKTVARQGNGTAAHRRAFGEREKCRREMPTVFISD